MDRGAKDLAREGPERIDRLLKENPGKATAGTVGVGGPEITGTYFQKKTGTSFQFVPYRGGAPLNQDKAEIEKWWPILKAANIKGE